MVRKPKRTHFPDTENKGQAMERCGRRVQCWPWVLSKGISASGYQEKIRVSLTRLSNARAFSIGAEASRGVRHLVPSTLCEELGDRTWEGSGEVVNIAAHKGCSAILTPDLTVCYRDTMGSVSTCTPLHPSCSSPSDRRLQGHLLLSSDCHGCLCC